MKHASKAIIPLFSAICLGAALGLCATRAAVGVSDAVTTSVQFDSETFWAQDANTKPAGADEFSITLGGESKFVFGSVRSINFSTDKDGQSSIAMAIAGPKEATDNMTVLHAMGRGARIGDGEIELSGLRPNSEYQVDVAVVDYEYSAQAEQEDPTHKVLGRSVFFQPIARHMRCAPNCALLLTAPRLEAIGLPGSLEHKATEALGQTSKTDLLLGAFGAMLAFGAVRVGGRKLLGKAAPAVGPLRVKV